MFLGWQRRGKPKWSLDAGKQSASPFFLLTLAVKEKAIADLTTARVSLMSAFARHLETSLNRKGVCLLPRLELR